jgi:hypothetical protein
LFASSPWNEKKEYGSISSQEAPTGDPVEGLYGDGKSGRFLSRAPAACGGGVQAIQGHSESIEFSNNLLGFLFVDWIAFQRPKHLSFNFVSIRAQTLVVKAPMNSLHKAESQKGLKGKPFRPCIIPLRYRGRIVV